MNLLELELINTHYKEGELILKIDGLRILNQIDDLGSVYFNELLASTKKSGFYLIFTCSCGVADCGAWEKIKVSHQHNTILWDFEYNGLHHFEFEKDFYCGEINRIRLEIQLKGKDFKLHPQYVIEPE